jgi:hypothetical protein
VERRRNPWYTMTGTSCRSAKGSCQRRRWKTRWRRRRRRRRTRRRR